MKISKPTISALQEAIAAKKDKYEAYCKSGDKAPDLRRIKQLEESIAKIERKPCFTSSKSTKPNNCEKLAALKVELTEQKVTRAAFMNHSLETERNMQDELHLLERDLFNLTSEA